MGKFSGFFLTLGLFFGLAGCGGHSVLSPSSQMSLLKEQTNYAFGIQQNTCKNDGSDLTVTRDLSTLIFHGGFDYQTRSPDEFDGYWDDDGSVRFNIEEGSLSLSCTASLSSNEFTGSCTDGTNTCNFSFLLRGR